jgi:prepilin-type N-terminal cleavage/methylation domain-containing protein
MRKNLKKGFTLIELLVVVSIISLLSSVVLSSIADARDKAAIERFKEDYRQIANALELYRLDEKEYPPVTGNPNNGTALQSIIDTYLTPYIDTQVNLAENIRSFSVSLSIYFRAKDLSNFMLRCGNNTNNQDYYAVLYSTSDLTNFGFEQLQSSINNGVNYNNQLNLYCAYKAIN